MKQLEFEFMNKQRNEQYKNLSFILKKNRVYVTRDNDQYCVIANGMLDTRYCGRIVIYFLEETDADTCAKEMQS